MRLITTKLFYGLDSNYENDLTREMDEHLINANSNPYFKTYIFKHDMRGNSLVLRYPGATRGHIEVDDDMVIKNIVLYDAAMNNYIKCYKQSVKDVIDKFIGAKIIFK